jgi:hypothetical protein
LRCDEEEEKREERRGRGIISSTKSLDNRVGFHELPLVNEVNVA